MKRIHTDLSSFKRFLGSIVIYALSSAGYSGTLQSGQEYNSQPPKTLLGLWSSEALAIHPNDKRIITLRPADHSPPDPTKTDQALAPLGKQFFQSIRRVRLPATKKMLALTFDLCEKANERTGYDSEIVSFLREHQIAATFFAGGKWLRSHEENALQLMAGSQFELANHGWTHGNLRVLKGQKMLEQITWTQAEYQRIWTILNNKAASAELKHQMQQIPSQPLLIRFPYGVCSPEALQVANGLGLAAIQWDVVSGDPVRGLSAMALKNNVLKSARSGSIVVFHANGRGHNTAKALPGIVKALQEKGYEFVTVSQLLKEGMPEVASECYELHPGDNWRYDKQFGQGTE